MAHTRAPAQPGGTVTGAPGLAPITTRAPRIDRSWAYSASTFAALLAFVVYSTYADT